MRIWAAIVGLCSALTACAAQQAPSTAGSLFASPAAERAKELAPDLHHYAETAWEAARQADRDGHAKAAGDFRTEARLWLAAAAAEAERVEIGRRRVELQAAEERWAKQLARDQAAAGVVAQDISRYEARSVALKEAERLSPASAGGSTEEIAAALLTRVRLNLALAEALGAEESELDPLEGRAESIEGQYPRSAKRAETLLLETEALIGDMRARWPEPLPGAAAELIQTALITGFSADRTNTGVIVRSERFFKASGQVSSATVKRFHGLLQAFPHGPVACQVAVPELRSRVWARRVASLVERFGRMDDPGRVSTGMVVTGALGAGTVQCTFAAYRGP
ncbi:MAG: hypothetical protein OEM15_05535 [Myxococcales bacterium]|nr:hypothetical protein [Myxococcales bacterium]MDH3484803.1 hypothetical protein [Myxococcales bacterium]